MSTYPSGISSDPPIIIAGGTTGREILRTVFLVSDRRRIRQEHGATGYFFSIDTQGSPPLETDPRRLSEANVLSLERTFMEARPPDIESRNRFQKTGQSYFLSDRELEGAVLQDRGDGTGNSPAMGRLFFHLNDLAVEDAIEKSVRSILDTRKRMAKVTGGDKLEERPITFLETYGTGGGLGNGIALPLCSHARQVAKRAGGRLNIILFPVCIGTFSPTNFEVARRNELNALNQLLLASMVPNMDLDGAAAQSMEPPFDSVILSYNAGPASGIATLREMYTFVAEEIFHLCYSPLSAQLRMRMVDLHEHRGDDETGAPNAGGVMGVARVDLDRSGISDYCGANLGASAADAVLTAPPGDAGAKGVSAADENSLVESDTRSLATRFLTRAADGEPDTVEELLGAFKDSYAGTRSMARLRSMVSAHQNTLANLLPRIVEGRMSSRARQLVENVRKLLPKEATVDFKSISGLRRQIAYSRSLLDEIEKYDRANAEQLAILRQAADSLMEQTASYRQRIGRLDRMHPVLRFLRPFTIGWLRRHYEHLALRAIRVQTSVSARSLLHETAFLPLLDLLRSYLAGLLRMQAQLDSAGDSLRRRAENLRRPGQSPYRFAVGVSVADGPMLQKLYERWVSKKDGEPQLIQGVFSEVLRKRDSMLPLLQLPPEGLTDELLSLCREPFAEEVKALNTLALFRERFGSNALSVLGQVLKESMPRAWVSGESNQRRVIARVMGVPAKSDLEWLSSSIRNVDKAPGDWEAVELREDSSAIEFVTFRFISLTDQMQQLKSRISHTSVRELLHGNAYPHTAVVPLGKLTNSDAMVTATHGVACGAITHRLGRGWELNGATDESQLLGATPGQVFRTLQTKRRIVVAIYRCLWHALLEQGSALTQHYEEMLAATAHQGSADVGVLWNEKSMRRALMDVRALAPMFSRLSRKKE